MSDYYAIAILSLITIVAFVLNLPFGYLRGNTKKFSVMWFLYIHLPIPAIFVLRTMAGFTYKAIPIIIVGAVLGQLIGSRIYNLRMSSHA
jgi:hypothetical protein